MRDLIIYIILSSTLSAAVIVDGDINNGANFGHDERYYLAALRSFHAGQWANSSKWFHKLLKEFPGSNKHSKAVLLLAQSMYKQENFKETYGVLSNNLQAAGDLADEYIYWMAECRVKQGNYIVADQHFRELLSKYPSSSRALAATVGSASMATKQTNPKWHEVAERLEEREGVFQIHAGGELSSVLLQEGGLLLAEAKLKQRDGEKANKFLARLPRTMEPERAWRRSLLRVQILAFDGYNEEAIAEIIGLRETLKRAKANVYWQVNTAKIHSNLLKKSGELNLAAEIYSELMGDHVETSVRTYSCLEAVRLYTISNRLEAAAKLLKTLGDFTDDNSTLALSRFLLGEIEFASGRSKKFSIALKYFQEASKLNISGELGARIHMRFGECFMKTGEAEKATAEFYKALRFSNEPIMSSRINYLDGLVKLSLGKLPDAMESFTLITKVANPEKGDLSYIKNSAQMMLFKLVVGKGNMSSAEVLLQKARTDTPDRLSYFLLGMAQNHIKAGSFGKAEEILIEFRKQDPEEHLASAAKLENIQILILKERWPEAIALYDQWLETYPNHRMASKVCLDRAWALMRSGRKVDAMKAYNKLASDKSKAPSVFAAKIWLADQNFNSVTNRLEAEKLYQEIAAETNCPPYLRHRSQLMAGRAALIRDGYDDARKSFVALLNDKSVSEPARIQATFALSDLTMIDLKVSPIDSLEAEKRQKERIYQSTNTLFGLTQLVQTNITAARAWGRIGDVSLMVARDRQSYYGYAKTAYEKSRAISEQKLKNTSGPQDFDDVLNQALMGLAYSADRSTVGKGEKIRKAALEDALKTVIDVYEYSYGQPDKKINLYWRGQSGIVAIRFMVELEKYDDALQKCVEMEKLFPGTKSFFQAKKKWLESLVNKKP